MTSGSPYNISFPIIDIYLLNNQPSICEFFHVPFGLFSELPPDLIINVQDHHNISSGSVLNDLHLKAEVCTDKSQKDCRSLHLGPRMDRREGGWIDVEFVLLVKTTVLAFPIESMGLVYLPT